MAVKTYYGTCTSAATASEKVVVIKSEEVTPNGFAFNEGDLLTVYFTESNEAENPSIVISNNSAEQAVSISTDSGKEIKTRNIQVDAVGAWDAGETVIFAYTGTTGNDNVYYWELVNGAPSTEEIYGVTKLFGNSNTSVSEWLSLSDPSDYTKALTPGVLKKYHKLLTGQASEEKQEFPTLKLTWFPSESIPEGSTMTQLGLLALMDDKNQGIEITYPIEQMIDQKVAAVNKTSTNEFINNGPGNFPENVTTDGGFYITNVLPSNKSLYYADTPNNYAFLVPKQDTTNNLVLNSPANITLNGTNGTVVNNGLTLNGALNTKGNTITAGAINSGKITASGAIDAGANQIKTTGRLDGKTIYENGTSLNTKYSGKLLVRRLTYKNISISKGGGTPHLYQPVAYSGYTPIGVVGINLDQVNTSQDASFCHLWEWSLKSNNVEFAIRNYKNRAVKINAIIDVLYVKDV